MKKYALPTILGLVELGLAASAVYWQVAKPVAGAQAEQSPAVFDSQSGLKLIDPSTFRQWVLVGAPFTPNGLNDGKANFPGFRRFSARRSTKLCRCLAVVTVLRSSPNRQLTFGSELPHVNRSHGAATDNPPGLSP